LIDRSHVAVFCRAGDADPSLNLPFAVGDASFREVSDRVSNRRESIFIRTRYVAEQFADAGRVVFFHGSSPFEDRVASRQPLDSIIAYALE
jgi:hypothetical protein